MDPNNQNYNSKKTIMEENKLEDKEYSILIKFRPIKDENGNVPKNASFQYSIELGQAIGLDCHAVISAGMFLVETIVKHIEKQKNEKDSLQLDESKAI